MSAMGDDGLQTVRHEDEGACAPSGGDLEERLDEGRHRDDEHDGHRNPQHPALAARALEEHGERGEDEGAEELVGGAEERPDVHVAGEAEEPAAAQREQRGDPGVAEELRNGALFPAVGRGEELLEAHAADAGNGVDRGHGEGGDAHRQDAGGDVGGEPKVFVRKPATAPEKSWNGVPEGSWPVVEAAAQTMVRARAPRTHSTSMAP